MDDDEFKQWQDLLNAEGIESFSNKKEFLQWLKQQDFNVFDVSDFPKFSAEIKKKKSQKEFDAELKELFKELKLN